MHPPDKPDAVCVAVLRADLLEAVADGTGAFAASQQCAVCVPIEFCDAACAACAACAAGCAAAVPCLLDPVLVLLSAGPVPMLSFNL